MLELLGGEPIEAALRTGRPMIAGEERAREVAEVAVATDDIGVEGDEFSRLDDPIGCLLKPRVGAWPRVQQPGFDVVATSGDDGLVEDGPKLVLADARHEACSIARSPSSVQRSELRIRSISPGTLRAFA